MKKSHYGLVPCAMLAASVLGGCAVGQIGPLKEEADLAAMVAADQLKVMRSGKKVEVGTAKPIAQHLDAEVYIPVRQLSAAKGAKANKDPVLARSITVNRTFTSAQELAERITALSGVAAIVSPDVTAIQPGQMGAGGLPGLQGQPAPGMPSLPPLPTMAGMPATSGMPMAAGVQYGMLMQPGGFPVSLSYSGTLAGFLDVATSRIGIAWDMVDGQIRLFRYISKTFRLAALPGDTSMDAKIGTAGASSSGAAGGTGGSSSQSGSSVQNSGVNFSGLSVWKGIEESVKAMLTQSGKIVVASALGTITVTDTPAVVAAVEKFVEQQNLALSRQVVVNVRVLSIDMSTTDSYGINWDIVYKSLSNNFGMAVNSGTAAIQGAGNVALSILGTAGQNGSTIKSWAGSKAIIEALSTQGKVSTLTSASVTTLNNQPAPIQVGRSTSYVASSATTISTGVATTSMTPGTVNSGFSMSLLPHIIDGNRMLLQYAVDMSSLLDIKTVSSGGSVLQTPDLDTRNSLQRVMVNSGDTIVVAGFENSEVNAKSQGVAGAENPALGGSVNGKRNKNTIVILMQPVIAE